jgi:hypothetical protein
MRRLPETRPVLALLLLAGCSAELPTMAHEGALGAQAAFPVGLQASHRGARPAVPIRGRCEMEAQPAEPVSPGVISQLDVGTCHISHLGMSTMTSDKLINLAAGTQTADVVFTAANGDMLYASGNGTNTMTAPGQVAFRVELTLAGGTGRFSDATGLVVSEGVAILAEAKAYLTMAGTIRY